MEIRTEIRSILWTAAALVVFLSITGVFPNLGQTTTTRKLESGREIDVAITLVTPDVNDLACAGDAVVGGASCAFDSQGQPSQRQGPVLAPYMTTDSVLFLVPDLWKEPALAKRLVDDPPGSRDTAVRFVATCKMKLVDPARSFSVRWTPNAEWGFNEEAWVGTISGCRLGN